MPQFFSRSANTVAKLSIFSAAVAVIAVVWISWLLVRSPYEMVQNVPREQPVPFSHQHHSGALGIDCRFCHISVERSASANIPATKICMNCHSQMWASAPMLAPVRESYRTGKSIEWTRVNDLPEYVYFNHSIHVSKGFGCSTCHGRVDKMPLTWQAQSLAMKWCLQCHENPQNYVRPRAEVFNMNWAPPPNQAAVGRQLVKAYHIQSLISCDTCHR